LNLSQNIENQCPTFIMTQLYGYLHARLRDMYDEMYRRKIINLFFFSFQVASLPTVNHNVLPPYQTSSSPKSTSSPSALQLHSNPAGSNPQDCIDYSSANDQKTVLGLSSTSSSSHGPSGSLPPGSGSVGGLPPPGTPQGNSGGVPWKYQSFQVL
jgi:hypothetical protein